MLLDPFLFGNCRNLVNKNDPFQKYKPTDLRTDKELIAGLWYQRTHDARINDPKKEFLLPIDLYIDKTSKTSSFTASHSEPVIMTTPLLTLDCCQEHDNAWRPLRYIPDLELSSSAKKKQAQSRVNTRGCGHWDYHTVFSVILESLKALQQSGSFNAYVQMGDEICYVKVIVVIATVQGDGKSGDFISGQFNGYSCSCRMSWLCMTGFASLSDPWVDCRWVTMNSIQQLYSHSVDPNHSQQERNNYVKALLEMKQHRCNLAFFGCDFGENPFGILLALAADMMHLFEFGVIPYLLEVFIGSISISK